MTTAPRAPAGVTPPDLADPRRFERRPSVPILDEHVRADRVVDARLLGLVCRNSNARAAAGDPALLLIGHTTDGLPEVSQPPVVGYVQHYAMGEWRGRPCLMADLFYATERREEALGYPRRSVEVYYSDDPAQNYIDAVSLLVRSPERDLGLVTYAKAGLAKERYSMRTGPAEAVGGEGLAAGDAAALTLYMQDRGLTDFARARDLYLADKRAGLLAEQAPPLTAVDAKEIQRYAARNGIRDGGRAVRMYRAAKAAGKLWD